MVVRDRIVAAPNGEEYVVEAWRASDAYGVTDLLAIILSVLMPGCRIGVKRFPVQFGARAIYTERVLRSAGVQRRVDELASRIQSGQVPRRR